MSWFMFLCLDSSLLIESSNCGNTFEIGFIQQKGKGFLHNHHYLEAITWKINVEKKRENFILEKERYNMKGK